MMSNQEEQNYEDYENAEELFYVSIGNRSAGVSVRTGSDGRGFLWTTDYVANDWLEVFPTLAMALGRFALLVACSGDEWARMFAVDSAEFVSKWSEFESKNLI
jgi:hypothetical protein